ncbi:MAG: right-handed parallel beta-helix repeat-containing protein [Anaerolineae bacterium]|nr:right-handed parallel beta-helix repeat-containing protein [Anaerolineae bacterium]
MRRTVLFLAVITGLLALTLAGATLHAAGDMSGQVDPTTWQTIDALVGQRFTQTAAAPFDPAAQSMTETADFQALVDAVFEQAVTATAAVTAQAAYTATAEAASVARAVQPARFDSDVFLDTHFHLQEYYTGVLCVSAQDDCPDSVEATVPCLTASCNHPTQVYPVNAKLNNLQLAAMTAIPGDLIIVMPGRYNGVLIERKSGADGAYIHFKAWQPGTVLVDVPVNADAEEGFNFQIIDANYYIVEGLTFKGASDAGLYVTGAFEESGHFATHIILTNVYSHDNIAWGMLTGPTSYLVVQDSVFTTSELEHGLYLSGSSDNVLIRRNVFQGNTVSGLQINPDPHEAALQLFGWLRTATGDTCGISWEDASFEGRKTWADIKACYDAQGLPDLGKFITDGISENVIVEQNILTGNGGEGGTALNMAALRDAVIRDNLFYGNQAGGIDCGDDYYAQAKGLEVSPFACERIQIVNNTVVDVGEAYPSGALSLYSDARDIVVANNIFVRAREDAYQVLDQASQGLVSRRNYYYSIWISSPGGMAAPDDSLTGFSIDEALANFVAPGFEPWLLPGDVWYELNPNRPDYHLLPGSVLVGAGDPLSTSPLDLEGTPRAGADLGALVPSGN